MKKWTLMLALRPTTMPMSATPGTSCGCGWRSVIAACSPPRPPSPCHGRGRGPVPHCGHCSFVSPGRLCCFYRCCCWQGQHQGHLRGQRQFQCQCQSQCQRLRRSAWCRQMRMRRPVERDCERRPSSCIGDPRLHLPRLPLRLPALQCELQLLMLPRRAQVQLPPARARLPGGRSQTPLRRQSLPPFGQRRHCHTIVAGRPGDSAYQYCRLGRPRPHSLQRRAQQRHQRQMHPTIQPVHCGLHAEH